VDGLDSRMANWTSTVCGFVNVSYGQGGMKSAESQGVFNGKVMIDDHSFCTAVKEGFCTDFVSGLLSNQGHSEGYRGGPYITNGSSRYRIRVKSV
jgi:hypothetical protein